MSAWLWGPLLWLSLSVLVGVLVARAIALRDRMERPTGPRVRVEARTVRPWVKP
jgi:hypothetical protein